MVNTMSKDELAAALRRNGVEVAERLRALPEETFAAGRYENGWDGRQILAHLAASEKAYPRLLDLARASGTKEAAAAVSGWDVNSYNQHQVDKRQGATPAQLIAEFEE